MTDPNAALIAEVMLINEHFPNYASWAIELPAGHWRAIIAALQRPTPPVGVWPTEEIVEAAWRQEVRAFADLMEAQLRANDHKPGWKAEPTWALYDRMREESRELLDALERRQLEERSDRSAVCVSAHVIGNEAADVANFAMMIADVCGSLTAAPAPQAVGGEDRVSPLPLHLVDARAVCDALGFDPTNHHNAAKCPYCSPARQTAPEGEKTMTFDEAAKSIGFNPGSRAYSDAKRIFDLASSALPGEGAAR